MISLVVLMILTVSAGRGHELNAGTLPVCSNRVINDVVRRAGCTVGDMRCWTRGGGFCIDYVEKRLGTRRPAKTMQLTSVKPEEVEKGDVAVFASRAHYAYVEEVVKDRDGRPVAVNLSEYNYGDCWVDTEGMITDKYGVVNRRRGVALRAVDGGFLRPSPVTR